MSERNEDDLELEPREAEALRQALRPFDAPAGFTDRVMARVLAETPEITAAQNNGAVSSGVPGHSVPLSGLNGAVPASSVISTGAGQRPGGELRGSASPRRGKLLEWRQNRLWISGLIAAALVAGIFEGEMTYRRVREQQRRIQEATRQFQTTERITLRALSQAREQLQRAGVPLSID